MNHSIKMISISHNPLREFTLNIKTSNAQQPPFIQSIGDLSGPSFKEGMGDLSGPSFKEENAINNERFNSIK
jgi:hypothetical protein